jgi:hypothetical protein
VLAPVTFVGSLVLSYLCHLAYRRTLTDGNRGQSRLSRLVIGETGVRVDFPDWTEPGVRVDFLKPGSE